MCFATKEHFFDHENFSRQYSVFARKKSDFGFYKRQTIIEYSWKRLTFFLSKAFEREISYGNGK